MEPIRVARVDELPPGAGKLVQVGAREIAVYNLEGRFYAASAGGRAHLAIGELACPPCGSRFDAAVDDSPRRLGRYQVTVEDDYIVLYLEPG